MRNLSICLALIVLGAGSVKADDTLGTADSFAVLAGSTVTNYGAGILGATVITGNLGVSPGPTCIGFVGCSTTGPGTVSGTIDLANGAAGSAMGNLNTAYTTLLGLSVGPHVTTVPGGILTGTYAPGVYIVSAPPSNLTGTIYLNDGDVAGSQFVFVMTSTLTTSSNSVVDVTGLSPGDSVFWVVESSATLGNNTAFEGNILANTSITFNPGATDLCGRALGELLLLRVQFRLTDRGRILHILRTRSLLPALAIWLAATAWAAARPHPPRNPGRSACSHWVSPGSRS